MTTKTCQHPLGALSSVEHERAHPTDPEATIQVVTVTCHQCGVRVSERLA